MKLRKKNNFTIVPNGEILDKTLSWKAKGIYSYLACRPDGWEFKLGEITSNAKDQKKATRSGVKELEEAGWLIRRRVRMSGGRFDYEYHLQDEKVEPCTLKGYTVKGNADEGHADERHTDNGHGISNTKENNTELNNTEGVENTAGKVVEFWNYLFKDSYDQNESLIKEINNSIERLSFDLMMKAVSLYHAVVNHPDVFEGYSRKRGLQSWAKYDCDKYANGVLEDFLTWKKEDAKGYTIGEEFIEKEEAEKRFSAEFLKSFERNF